MSLIKSKVTKKVDKKPDKKNAGAKSKVKSIKVPKGSVVMITIGGK